MEESQIIKKKIREMEWNFHKLRKQYNEIRLTE